MPKRKRNYLNNSSIFANKNLDAQHWVSQSEAARIRGVSPQAIGQLIQKGRFRTFEIGGKVLLNRRDVETYKPKKTGRPRKAK